MTIGSAIQRMEGLLTLEESSKRNAGVTVHTPDDDFTCCLLYSFLTTSSVCLEDLIDSQSHSNSFEDGQVCSWWKLLKS